MMAHLKTSLSILIKLGVAAAVILGAAWAIVVYQPDGSVQTSNADILDLNFVKLSNPARFSRALKHLGHDTPQTFSINGNIINFSVNYSPKRPEQLLLEYQDEFVHQGLNRQVWHPRAAREQRDEMVVEAMAGGVMPIAVSPGYVSMGGVIPGNDATNLEELLPQKRSLNDRLFKGHHFVEMFWDEMARRTTVTASWSDENFDYLKMKGESLDGKGLDVDLDVPACPGCTRITRVRDLDPTRDYSSNTFIVDRPISEVFEFYREAMHRRGWTESEVSQSYQVMLPHVSFQNDDAMLVEFSRGDERLSITGYLTDTGETTIYTTQTR